MGNKSLHKILATYKGYNPLSYVLIFLCDEDGWDYRMLTKTAQTNGVERRVAQAILTL